MRISPSSNIIEALNRCGLNPTAKSQGRWESRCPAHDDHDPSLTVTETDDGKILLHCHAGCPYDAVVSSLDLKTRDLFPALNGSAPRRPAPKPKFKFRTF
jgi:hypothetical protein